MNLVLLKAEEISADGKSAELPGKDARTKHILGHLRKSSGDKISIGIIGGSRGKAVLETAQVEGGVLRLLLTEMEAGSSSTASAEITLLLAMPFPKRLKALWPMIASFGVKRIVVVRGQLSDADHCKSSCLKAEVYEPLIVEGMSQGGHTRRVTVDVEIENTISKDILSKLGLYSSSTNDEAKNGIAKIFLDCGDEDTIPPPAREIILTKFRKCEQKETTCKDEKNKEYKPSAVIAVGPERGWTEDEAKIFAESGFDAATLGSSILRVDTAVIAGLGIVSAALDECLRLHEKFNQTIQESKHVNKRRKL